MFWGTTVWFVLSVLFLGTPSPLLLLLPGIFVVSSMVMYDSAGTIPVIYIFGSFLNFVLYNWIAKIIGNKINNKSKK